MLYVKVSDDDPTVAVDAPISEDVLRETLASQGWVVPKNLPLDSVRSLGYDAVPLTEDAPVREGFITGLGIPEWDEATGSFKRTYTFEEVPLPPFEEFKAQKIAELQIARKNAEENGFDLHGLSIRLDEGTQTRISAAVAGLERQPPGTLIDWQVNNDTYVSFDLDSLSALGDSVFLHVQRVFSRSRVLRGLIDEATSSEELAAIDLYSGWS